VISLSFNHVNHLSCSGKSISANSSTKFLNAQSLNYIICVDLSCGLRIKLKAPHSNHGISSSGLFSLICYRKSSLSAPLVIPYTPITLILKSFILTIKFIEAALCFMLDVSSLNMLCFHVSNTLYVVPTANIYIYRESVLGYGVMHNNIYRERVCVGLWCYA
jgi:hypothetical protein